MNRTRRMLGFLVCAAVVLSMAAESRLIADEDQERVSRLLDRLGLTDIEILHLEKMLAQGPPAVQRTRIGKKLADLYAAKLMSVAGDEQKSEEVQQRIATLIRTAPEVNTPSLKVMLLQADYNHAESLVTQWTADPSNSNARDEARRILEQITPQLNSHQTQLNAEIENLVDVLNELPEGEEYDAKEKALLRLQAVAGRATYFAGWSNYYLGMVKEPRDTQLFVTARDAFRQLLDIGDVAYEELDAEWLGLESVWRSRAMIGLGLAEAATSNIDASRRCFQVLKHTDVLPEIQDQAPYWYVQGLLNAGEFEEAKDYAEQEVNAFTGKVTQGKFSLCVSLVRAGFGSAAGDSPGIRREMGMVGLRGLAKLGQQKAVGQLMEQYQIQLDDGGGFLLRWIEGRRLLAEADKSKETEDYASAARALQNALNAPDADQQVTSAAQCRYELAWCLYKTGQYEDAARAYQQAVTGMKASDGESAARAAWMAFASYQKLLAKQPRFRAAAIEALRSLKRNFPDHEYARRADYYINKLSRPGVSPEETIADLEKLAPSAPSYLSARYDICLLTHQLWRAADAGDRPKLAERVAEAVRRYLRAAGSTGDVTSRLKCHLLMAETALGSSPPDTKLAAQFLGQAEPLIDQVSNQSSTAAEYHYYALQLAGKTGDDLQRREHAEWLVENAPNSAYELPALIVAANAIDKSLAAAPDSRKADLRDEALRIYERLVQRQGDSPEAISAKKNVRVAISRLAGYAYDADRYAMAAGWLEKLLAAFPADKEYLRRAGLAHFQARDYGQALKHWRSLLAGVPKNSEEWFEAKYHQLCCLFETDPATAQRVFKQYRLLHPDLGPAEWREKFRQLSDRGERGT